MVCWAGMVVDDAGNGRYRWGSCGRDAVAAVCRAAVGADVCGRIGVWYWDRRAIDLAIAKLGDEPAADAGFALGRRRGEDAFEAEMGALGAGLVAVAADFADTAAVAGSRYSAGHAERTVGGG